MINRVNIYKILKVFHIPFFTFDKLKKICIRETKNVLKLSQVLTTIHFEAICDSSTKLRDRKMFNCFVKFVENKTN